MPIKRLIAKEDFFKIKDLYLKEKKTAKQIAKIFPYSHSYITKVLSNNDIYVNTKYINKERFKKGDLTKEVNRLKDELLKKEIIFRENIEEEKNDNLMAVCKKTGKKFRDYKNSSGVLTEHIKKYYPEVNHPSNFFKREFKKENGKYWHEQFFDIIIEEEIKKETKTCKYCNWTTCDLDNKSGAYTTHLQSEHNIGLEQYIKENPEEEILFKTFIDRLNLKNFINENSDNNIQCQLCGKTMKKITNTHLLNEHNISTSEYRKRFGQTMSETTKVKFSKLWDETNQKNRVFSEKTSIELSIQSKLEELNLNFKDEKRVGNFYYDFFLPDYNIFIEADGFYWHGHDRNSNWDITPFRNIVNDYKKSQKVEKLYRLIENISINQQNLNQISSADSFLNFLTKENFDIKNHKLFNLKENEVIFSKSFCEKKKELLDNKDIIKRLVYLFKNFYHPQNSERFIDLNSRINGTSTLKGIFFKDFYTAHKAKNKNINEIFQNKDLLEKVIRYRLGLNAANEYFDISVKNLYRGLEVSTMFHVSIFPPEMAKSIYGKNVLEGELVFDPFAGWGSRLFGMKDLIQDNNCRYVGFDNNENLKDGYEKIVNMFFEEEKDNISFNTFDSKQYVKELENKVDFIFTSPPFYNDEIYTDEQHIYESINEWSNDFLIPIFSNCYNYLKKGKFIIIDIKEKYLETIKRNLLKSGFELCDVEYYDVAKSHYSKVQKQQCLVKCKK